MRLALSRQGMERAAVRDNAADAPDSSERTLAAVVRRVGRLGAYLDGARYDFAPDLRSIPAEDLSINVGNQAIG